MISDTLSRSPFDERSHVRQHNGVGLHGALQRAKERVHVLWTLYKRLTLQDTTGSRYIGGALQRDTEVKTRDPPGLVRRGSPRLIF